MRRLAVGLLIVAAVFSVLGNAVGAQDDNPGDDGDGGEVPTVDVLEVSGLVDDIVASKISDTIDESTERGAQALILRVNSRGAVISRPEMTELLEKIDDAEITVAVWVGPSGSRLYGMPMQLLAVADVTGMAPGARIGHMSPSLSPNGEEVDFGAATDELRDGTLGLSEARELEVFKQRISDEGIPAIVNMVHALDGYTKNGVTLETTTEVSQDDGTIVRDTVAPVRLMGLDLIDEVFHTVASPAMTYLLLLLGLSLLIFEFYTAGVGVAGVVGAAATFLACTGLAALPARPWAIGLIVAAMLAFAIDVQVGVPRFWTGVGVVATIIGSWFLFEPLPGTSLRPSWITLLAGILGIMLTYIVGMPSMVRTRFATPTIGREWMVDKLGEVTQAVAPIGVVTVEGAQWRARTNRATPVAAGEQVRVAAIDGITLEVEPLEGAARDYREMRAERRTSKHDGVEHDGDSQQPDVEAGD